MPSAEPDAPLLILASASPRRHAILRALGFAFEIDPADVDETPPTDCPPREVAVLLAERKARVVAARRPGSMVIGSDTIVLLGDRLLGKPADAAEARSTLSALSDSTHEVITGVAIIDGAHGRELSGASVTRVTMRALLAAEIDDYVASGECFGKAGAYAIQEKADRFVTDLDGAYDNVVGFPSALFLSLMEALELRPPLRQADDRPAKENR